MLQEIYNIKKWRQVFTYQYLMPLLALLAVSFYSGMVIDAVGSTMMEFLFNGELSLISVFLIIGVGIELSYNENKYTITKTKLNVQHIWEFCLPIAMLGMMFYGFNKNITIICGDCISRGVISWKEYFWMGYNLIFIIAAPIYVIGAIYSRGQK